MNKIIEIKCEVNCEDNSNYNCINGPVLKKDLTIKDAIYIIERVLLLDSVIIEDNYKEKWKDLQADFKKDGFTSYKEVLIDDLTSFIEGRFNIDDYCLNAGIYYEEDFPLCIYIGVSLLKFLQDKNYI